MSDPSGAADQVHTITITVSAGSVQPIAVDPDSVSIVFNEPVRVDKVQWVVEGTNAPVEILFDEYNPFSPSGLSLGSGTGVAGITYSPDNFMNVKSSADTHSEPGDPDHDYRDFKYTVKVPEVGKLDPVIVIVSPKTPE